MLNLALYLWTTSMEYQAEKSAKVTLRNLSMDDVQHLIEIANHKDIANDMIKLPSPFGKEDALAVINEGNGRDNIIKGIVECEEDKLIGVIKLRNYDAENNQIELSFWTNPNWWGKGYAKDACTQMLEKAFTTPGINRVYAYNLVRNEFSSRVIQRIGMVQEGIMRDRIKKNGVFEDVYISAILKRDWLNMNNPH